MPTIQVEAHVSGRDLLQAVAQLGPSELAQFVADVRRLQAERQVPRVSAEEESLLLRINEGLSPDSQRRYTDLIAKRDQQTLTADERAELLRLTDEAEQCEANRIDALTQLAQRRGTTLSDLMTHLGIPVPRHE
jgi:hypothetical protein